ncbi:MAG: YggS family pyridoxal phosphate-dependent enzyme [Planctomycetota bacterium]
MAATAGDDVGDFSRRLAAVRDRIAEACGKVGRAAEDVAVLAVSKRHPVGKIEAAFACGQFAFGENRVQELVAKAEHFAADPPAAVGSSGLAKPIEWHLIGSLQTNKVKDVVGVAGLTLLHSMDRRKLADELQRSLLATDQRMHVLLQVNASGEEQKHGCPVDAAAQLLEHVQTHCGQLEVDGLMAMGPLDGDPAPVFARVADLHDKLRQASGLKLPTRSLGMSGDLEQAIAAGSTMVRIGTALFGARPPMA